MSDLVLFSKLLHSVGLEQMANSRINHHANGMDYLCLLRTPKLTVKLYRIKDTAKNVNSGYLVHPHNHRYGFSSVLLHGDITHIRFKLTQLPSEADSTYDKWVYSAENKKGQKDPRGAFMLTERIEHHRQRGEYLVNPYEIHTLRIKEGQETLIGLIQYEDTAMLSDLYLPSGKSFDDLPKVDTRTPTVDEFVQLREDCINLFKTGVGMELYV